MPVILLLKSEFPARYRWLLVRIENDFAKIETRTNATKPSKTITYRLRFGLVVFRPEHIKLGYRLNIISF